MLIDDILISFVVFVFVTGSIGYALVRLLETAISISARTRQMLFAAVMLLPLTTFALNIIHWTKVCSFLTARFTEQTKLLFIPHSGSIMLLLAGLALMYIIYSLRGPTARHSELAVFNHPMQYERVSKLIAGLGAPQLDLVIYETPYPFACVSGVWKPKVLLASGLLEVMDDQELRAVLAHELAHVKSNDNLLNQVLVLIRHLTFFSPVTHLAHIRYSIAREEAADDLAATMLAQPTDLASALVKVIRASQQLTQWQPRLRAQSPLQSSQALQRAERILSEPYAVPHNLLLEQGILFLVSGILPMLFC